MFSVDLLIISLDNLKIIISNCVLQMRCTESIWNIIAIKNGKKVTNPLLN